MPINYFNIGNGVAGFSQKHYKTEPHAHFSIELAFALSGSLTVNAANHEYSNVDAVIIGSNVSHTFSCLGGECQLYFIDPTGIIGERVMKDYGLHSNALVILDMNEMKKFMGQNNFIVSVGPQPLLHSNKIDDRIQKCLEWIEANCKAEGINLTLLSEKIFLSESRLAHLFKEQIGISIRQYILWKKIEMAAKKSMEGCSLTECAHFAGFTDSSHFTRTFKKMFGVKPFFALKE